MRFLLSPLRTPGPHRCRVPMFLLVVALLTAALPVASAGTRFLPAVRTGEAPPDTEASPPAAGPDEDAGAGAGAGAGDGTFAALDGGPVWPLAGRPSVLRGWEPPATPYGPGHRGVDLAARPGDAVVAAATGRVSFAGRVAGRGVLVIELAGSGAPPLRTTYEPVRALVDKDDEVVAGQPVGVMEAGPFHCAGGCLHWGLRRGDAYLDPLSLLPPALLRRGPSRLLPVFGVPEPGGAAGDAALSRVRRAGSSRRRCPR
ncbi:MULTISPECIES: murein hydrolase activator EnvC [unclassified Streptomyces]|uniref:murein hydrolase activator EnvC family protein n=1 Tax=unclassified Streptomyces TaxID=2593676 RepID=UPI001BE72164|nr:MULTISPECIES: M23 family metallopeptidase [unclassified Streptomyces]MBT2426223.1 M23 family metallopeptidase [Streptomyces sp. ISL-112]MBT2460153.1 M23 family metallopeptidase [Streptomyces sp. ISL-63]